LGSRASTRPQSTGRGGHSDGSQAGCPEAQLDHHATQRQPEETQLNISFQKIAETQDSFRKSRKDDFGEKEIIKFVVTILNRSQI
jgi:hypothetical protein